MAGLVWTVSRRQIMPRRARAQDPHHAIHYPAGIAPSTPAPIGALSPLLVPIHERPDVFPLRIGEISHASHLLQLRSCRKCLFRRDVDEIASQCTEHECQWKGTPGNTVGVVAKFYSYELAKVRQGRTDAAFKAAW
jgi:hypothetical protein